MPRLNLLAEYGDDFVAIFLEERVLEWGCEDSFEEFSAEGTDVVEVCDVLAAIGSGMEGCWERGGIRR